MPEKQRILVVDDDVHICELVRLYLEKEGFGVLVSYDGEHALSTFRKIAPALVVLDIMLPKADGIEVCREIRRISNIPVIILSARGETFDKVLALELGADDYIVKPFEAKEFVARVKAVLRRYDSKGAETDKEVLYPNLSVNLTNYELKVGGKSITLPPKELELLYWLARHPNRVFTREELLETVWGFDYFGDSRTVDVHVKRLREKLAGYEESWQLKTVWGVGYKFEVR